MRIPEESPAEADLRQQLATERTEMANERTLLAYGRTSLAILVTGISIITLVASPWIRAAGGILIGVALLIFGVGVYRYWQHRHRLKSQYFESSNQPGSIHPKD